MSDAEDVYHLTRKFLGAIDPDDLIAAARLAEARQDLAGRQARAWGELTAAERADATGHAWAWLLAARNAGLTPTSVPSNDGPQVGDRVRLTYGDGSGCEGTWEIDADGDPGLRLDDGTWHGHVAGQVRREIVRTGPIGVGAAAESDTEPITLPEPDEWVDVDELGRAPVWRLRSWMPVDAMWVRGACGSAPLEVAGAEFTGDDLAEVERDLLALLAAVRFSRSRDDTGPIGPAR